MSQIAIVILCMLASLCAAWGDPGPAALASPLPQLDTWRVPAGAAEGWAAGDHVKVTRGGQPVAEGVLLSVKPHSADIVLTRTVTKPQRGDVVAFERHRAPLPKDPPPSNGVHMPGSTQITVEAQTQSPTEWKLLGQVEGLIGDDWMERNTRCAHVYARKGDIGYLAEVVDMLDTSYDMNRRFMGLSPRLPMTFYFFPLENPAHTQPKFQQRLANRTRFAGVALHGTRIALMNLGNWRTSSHYQPWEVEKVCRHEMNHIFAFGVRGADRLGTWEWLYEALAHTIEDTARPASVQLTLPQMKAYMANYHSNDASWKALIGDRNDDNLENFRDYSKLLVSIIFFLQDRYGQDVVARLMQASQGHDLEDAFIQITGKGTHDLEAEWKAYYGMR